MLLLVTYDLIRPGQQYEPLIAAIERRGGKRILLSTWLMPAKTPADNVAPLLNALRTEGKLDDNDRIFITAVVQPAAWWNVRQSQSDMESLYRTVS